MTAPTMEKQKQTRRMWIFFLSTSALELILQLADLIRTVCKSVNLRKYRWYPCTIHMSDRKIQTGLVKTKCLQAPPTPHNPPPLALTAAIYFNSSTFLEALFYLYLSLSHFISFFPTIRLHTNQSAGQWENVENSPLLSDLQTLPRPTGIQTLTRATGLQT